MGDAEWLWKPENIRSLKIHVGARFSLYAIQLTALDFAFFFPWSSQIYGPNVYKAQVIMK